ncbi:MAG: SpoIIE family protein phosphatase [Actinobacteria bacterium]|nr:SpoIIE family protein phosphatase [Actinomycetota bacterium]MCG2818791.1 SpoIIE family protein phosphatase [Actinomycetes bacterium]MBU4178676.1 SpoIIE family protein phosphatase [Actinomycetota bacterium]MBU4217725.1 SpoIIE family protein phosphatase [Actinomycetota bacterium]MBU4358962.1 SpoIIE family protein phosphatase [Actinomycetota bacterium]
MSDYSEYGAEKGKISPEVRSLRREVAGYLREEKDALVKEIDRLIEATLPEYQSLPADTIADVRQSFRDFIQIYLDYFEADDFPVKYIKSMSEDVGRQRAGQGIKLRDVISVFNDGETYTWRKITGRLLGKGYSAEAWVELANTRDRFNKLVRHYMRNAFEKEELTTVERQLTEFKALSILGQAIVSTVDLEKVLGYILEVATSLMRVKMGSILLLDADRKYLRAKAEMGLARSWVQKEEIGVDRSIADVAMRRNEYVLVRDAELIGFELPWAAAGRKIRSALSIPITVNEEPIGVIELYDTTPKSYTELDMTMLTTLGPQAGIAIKNAELFREEQKRRRQAIVLTEIAQASVESRDLDELMETITEKTAIALGVERCSLFFFEPETNTLTFMAGYGRSTLQVWMLSQFHMPMDELGQTTARAMRERRPVLAERVEDESDRESRVFRPGVKTYLQVPLSFEDELIALVSLESTSADFRFSADDIDLADALGRQAALAIQNRKLQDKLFQQQLAVQNAEVNERLYREREKSEAVLKATPDAVLVVDSEMRVVLANPAVEFMTGWSQEEARGRSYYEVLFGLTEEPEDDFGMRKMFAGERVIYREDEIVTRSGRRIPAGGTLAAIYDPDGNVENVVVIYRDTSEQKELEKFALMQREMDIASGIQSSLLPRDPLLAGGVHVVAVQQQAKVVGGDWYDYWWHGDKVFLVVGDASGSGVGAALFATMAMSALRVEAREQDKILKIMEHVNQNLYMTNRSDNFVTVFFGVLDLPTMTLSYTNAGHEEPLCIGAEDRTPVTLQSEDKSILGIFSRADLDVRKRKLNSGERLVLFTDGLIDAQNSKGKLYGLKRLDRFVTSHQELPSDKFAGALIENVLEFCNGDARDDMTVMVCDIL